MPPIALLTDFGTSDHYVAQMKGVILGIAPGVSIVDVTHEIPPQDVRRGAFLLDDLHRAGVFCAGTVHVAVVDPGVGSERSLVAVAADDQFYIAPDNGLLTLILDRASTTDIISLSKQQFQRSAVSSTFHGRDVMAPAAAHLARGLPFRELGTRYEREPVRLSNLHPVILPRQIEGSIAWVDRFGNLVTNINVDLLSEIPSDRLRLTCDRRKLVGLKRFYAEVPAGEPLLLIGSSGRLEIAVNGGSAAHLFGASAGDRVIVDRAAE